MFVLPEKRAESKLSSKKKKASKSVDQITSYKRKNVFCLLLVQKAYSGHLRPRNCKISSPSGGSTLSCLRSSLMYAQACHFSENSRNSEEAGFDFRDCFNLFRGTVSFQTKKIASKLVDQIKSYERKCVKLLGKPLFSYILHSYFTLHFFQ